MAGWKVLACAAAVAAILCGGAVAVIEDHEIKSLPGWYEDLPSKQWSGYMPIANGERFIHYWFIESENDPKKDPVTIWYQGGPGGSGVETGLLTELGPWSTNDDSFTMNKTEVPAIFHNEYGWQKVSNMLFVSAPAGVSFSYCDPKCPSWNDTTAAIDNHDFLQQFFQAYSEYASNDFYITGESYAGIYIPTLVEQIMLNDTFINLKGFAIGDGCLGLESKGACGTDYVKIQMEFLFEHGQFSAELHDEILSKCGSILDNLGLYDNMPEDPVCAALLREMDYEVGGYNVYNIYDECELAGDNKLKSSGTSFLDWTLGRTRSGVTGLQGALNDYKCGANKAAQAWLSNPDVQKALHVDPSLGDHSFDYHSTEKDLRPMYPKFVENYRVMIYSGDVDACVPYSGTEMWTSNLGFHVSDDWRPWTLDGERMGGYVTEYLYGQFLYVTVRGAGHMVPQHKPEAALTMFSNFISQTTFKPYGSEGPSKTYVRPEHIDFVVTDTVTTKSPEPTPSPSSHQTSKTVSMMTWAGLGVFASVVFILGLILGAIITPKKSSSSVIYSEMKNPLLSA